MNDQLLQKLATEIANQTILNSWPFYLLLIAMSFVGTTAGAYLRAHLAKRGEVAATKADAAEIIAHLKKTTEATKAVELSLSHSDWIRREENMLKRAKLEQLVKAAFALSARTAEMALGALRGQELQDDEGNQIYEFEMLATLYFPELTDETRKIEALYHQASQTMSPIWAQIALIKTEIDIARGAADTQKMVELAQKLSDVRAQHTPTASETPLDVYKAVHALSLAARQSMARLTTVSPPVQPV